MMLHGLSLFLVSALSSAGVAVDSGKPPIYSGAELLKNASKELKLEGAAVIIVQVTPKGPVDLVRSYTGNFSPDTELPIASVTKMLTAATIATLVDRGRLSFDTPISHCIGDAPAAWHGMTIRQTLSHLSGLPGLPPGRESRFADLATSVDEMKVVPLKGAPGKIFVYSGTAYQVAARCAERLEGKDFRSIFAERIAKPLELKATRYFGAKAPLTGGGIVTSPSDMERFARMLLLGGKLDGVRVLKTGTIEDMARMIAAPSRGAETPAIANGFAGTGTGFWCERVTPSGRCVSIAGLGAFGSYLWVDFEKSAYGVMLVRTDPTPILPVWRAIRAAAFESHGSSGQKRDPLARRFSHQASSPIVLRERPDLAP